MDLYGKHDALMPADEDMYGSKPFWLYDVMSRSKAEDLLGADMTPGNFLVRKSEKNPDGYVVSVVVNSNRVEHHVVTPNASGAYEMNGKMLSYPIYDVYSLVRHLQSNPEDMSCCLLPTYAYSLALLSACSP